jgi:hypothetical protein
MLTRARCTERDASIGHDSPLLRGVVGNAGLDINSGQILPVGYRDIVKIDLVVLKILRAHSWHLRLSRA